VVSKLKAHPDWDWFEAIYLWEYGEKDKLAALILERPIPNGFRRAISDIVNDIKKPNIKAASKLSFTPGEWLNIHVDINELYEQIVNKAKQEIKNYPETERPTQEELLEILNEQRVKLFKRTARKYEISYNTVKNSHFIFQVKLSHWM
jgi:hypothetical protein